MASKLRSATLGPVSLVTELNILCPATLLELEIKCKNQDFFFKKN